MAPNNLQEAALSLNDMLQQLLQRPAFEDPTKAAIRSVWRAVDRTSQHLALQREAGVTIDEPRQELADLWSDAALAIVDLDPRLAEMLRYKAEYWSDPRNWHDVDGLDISIESVRATARSLLPRATRPVADPPAVETDVFVSYAHEDNAVAKGLTQELRLYGHHVWFDDHQMRVGMSIQAELDKALGRCRHAVTILSPDYMQKEWTQRELEALLALEATDGRKRILPVLHRTSPTDITFWRPTLGPRLGISTGAGLAVVASRIADVLANQS